jgi:hypothetical protein
MKVDGGLEVVIFTEAIGHLLDRLNLGVQAITHGTGDSFLEVSGDMGPVAFDHLGHRPQRCQTRMVRPSGWVAQTSTRRSGTFNAIRTTVHGSNNSNRYR